MSSAQEFLDAIRKADPKSSLPPKIHQLVDADRARVEGALADMQGGIDPPCLENPPVVEERHDELVDSEETPDYPSLID